MLPTVDLRRTTGTVATVKELKDGVMPAQEDLRSRTISKMVPTLSNGFGSVKGTAKRPTLLSKVVSTCRSKAVRLARNQLALSGKAVISQKLVKVFALTLPSTSLLSKVYAKTLTPALVDTLLVYLKVWSNA